MSARALVVPASRPLRYAEMAPSGDAAAVALSYWAFDVHALPSPTFCHRVWPDGCCSLVFVIANHQVVAARVQGMYREPLEVPVQAGARYCGIRFRPEVGALWCGRAPAELENANLDARELFGGALDALLAVLPAAGNDTALTACFDAWIDRVRATRAPSTAVDDVVREAVTRLLVSDGRVRIAHLATSLQVTPRTLQRRFAAAVGLTPKQFAQIRRARAMLQRSVQDPQASRTGWSGLAADGGYADQAHLTREVNRLTRFSPTQLKARLEVIEHANFVE